MSVAFVREESAAAAQEVSLPKRTVSPYPNLVTKTGLAALQAAESHARDALAAAHALEDLSARRRATEAAARDLEYFVERLKSAELRPDPDDPDCVVFGARVTLLREGGRQQIFRIVGEDEADPRRGTLSYVSPLARLIAGKRVGDSVEFDGREIEVLAID